MSEAFFILFFMYHSENFQKRSVCIRFDSEEEIAYTTETSTINTALLSHLWNKVCTQ